MGKWEAMLNGNIEYKTGGVIAYALDLVDCVDIVDAHNADCDVYEARIDRVLAVLRREDISYGAMSEIRAIVGGETP